MRFLLFTLLIESALLKMWLKVQRSSLQFINLDLLRTKRNENWTFWGSPFSTTIWLVWLPSGGRTKDLPDGHKNLPFLPEELKGASGPTIKKFEILKFYCTSYYNCTISSKLQEPRYNEGPRYSGKILIFAVTSSTQNLLWNVLNFNLWKVWTQESFQK